MTASRDQEGPAADGASPGGRTTAEADAATLATGASSVEGAGLYRLLVDRVRDYAIFALDPTGHILSWNAGAERLKGYRPDEIIGQHFSIFYTAPDLAIEKPRWELEIAEREGKYEEEGWRLRKDGSRFWANVLITAMRDDAGALVGFAKVTRDLTERKAAQERAMEDARRVAEAEAESRTKSEFLRAMSHELRTPINATLGFTDLLELGVSGSLTDRQAEYLQRIRKSQEHLLRIINDLLNYSRIEAGHLKYDLGPLSIGELVDEVLPMLEPQATAKGISLSHDGCPPNLIVQADRLRTEQIMLNLLSNAVKFTPPDGQVMVRCERGGDRALIRVVDTGPGIPPDQVDSIFEPFVQLGRTLSSGHEGSGLGLAISRDLARGMNGDLSVRSGPDGGSTFTLTLPLASAS